MLRRDIQLMDKQSQRRGSAFYCNVLGLSLTAVILASLTAYYARFLPVGSISGYDEYYTLDRSTGFERHNDYLTVYSNNAPTFKKPPLQYWVTGWMLDRGVDREFALRFPSFASSILVLFFTGMLAYNLSSYNVSAIPLTILLMASSDVFWTYALSAMLDSSATLFVIMAITGVFLAFHQPKWWYLVAVSVGLGSLQKAPIALPIVITIVLLIVSLQRWQNIDVKYSIRNKHFYISLFIAAILILSWPCIQLLQYDYHEVFRAYEKQADRFTPGSSPSGRFSLIMGSEVWLRMFGIAALACIPFIYRRVESLALLVVFGMYCLLVVFASGSVYPRYSLLFVPMLMASLAAVLLSASPLRLFCAVPLLLGVLLLGQPFKDLSGLKFINNGQANLPLLDNLGSALRSDETLVLCRNGPYPPGAVSYFASNGRPFAILKAYQFAGRQKRGQLTPPYRGLCSSAGFDIIKKSLDSYDVVERVDGWVHWRSPRIEPDK